MSAEHAPFAFVAHDGRSRRFEEVVRVRLSDSDVSGRLRLDGVARFLQDVAIDDWADTGIDSDDTWVVRRSHVRPVPGAHWPRYLDEVTVVTFCSGIGAAWAERRTDLLYRGATVIETATLWVPISPLGRPVRIRESFVAAYGPSIRDHKVSGRVHTPEVSVRARRRPWSLRTCDFDVVGHVNNAAAWQALAEVVSAPFESAVVTHHGPLDRGDEVVLADVGPACWLLVDDEVRVSARFRR